LLIHLDFQSLVTPPRYRRRGAGSLLLKAIMDFGALTNLPIYLLASPYGLPLYKKAGFKEVSSFEVDVSQVTTEKYFHVGMVLPAPNPDQPPKLPSPVFPVVQDVEIKPITTLEDFNQMAQISDQAFGPNELFKIAFGGVDHQTKEERGAKALEESKKHPEQRYFKAVDTKTGNMIGSARWYFASDPEAEHHPYGPGFSPGTNIELAEKHFGECNRHRERRMKGKPHAVMCVLVVAPEAQRRGVGSKLLRHTLADIDELGWETWIDATPEGLELYKRFGWEVAEVVTTDLIPYGGTKSETTVCLIRPPGAKEATRV
jgi:GNAT superfamily N-acetyltransferase